MGNFFYFLISCLVFGSIFADPLKNYDAEISEYTNKDSSFFRIKKNVKLNNYSLSLLKIGRKKNILSIITKTNLT